MKTTMSKGIDIPMTVSGRIFKNAGDILVKLPIVLLVLIEIYPIVWLLLSSIKAPSEFSLRPIYALPDGFYWKNYVDAWTVGKLSIYFKNSILATFPSLLLVIGLGTAAAFGIEILKWRFSNSVLLAFMAGILVPMQMVLLPLFTIYYRIDLLNTRLGLILLYTAFGLPLTVFLMSGYFKAVPRELLESAIMDGANIYQVFFRVALPMVKNPIVTILSVSFLFMWNDLLLSLTFNTKVDLRTVQTGLLNFVGQYGQRQWGPTFAAVAMTVIPTLVVYLLLNEVIIEGLTSGAVKG